MSEAESFKSEDRREEPTPNKKYTIEFDYVLFDTGFSHRFVAYLVESGVFTLDKYTGIELPSEEDLKKIYSPEISPQNSEEDYPQTPEAYTTINYSKLQVTSIKIPFGIYMKNLLTDEQTKRIMEEIDSPNKELKSGDVIGLLSKIIYSFDPFYDDNNGSGGLCVFEHPAREEDINQIDSFDEPVNENPSQLFNWLWMEGQGLLVKISHWGEALNYFKVLGYISYCAFCIDLAIDSMNIVLLPNGKKVLVINVDTSNGKKVLVINVDTSNE